MKFETLDCEEVIYEEGDWKLTIDTELGIESIYQANYDRNSFVYCAYKLPSSNHFTGNVTIKDLPEDMQDVILKELI